MKTAILVFASRVCPPELLLLIIKFILILYIDVIMAREVSTTHSFGEKPWLGFEHVTMVPICRKLIDAKLLTIREKKWLNDYHADVLEKTRRYFVGRDVKTMKWLIRETQPV